MDNSRDNNYNNFPQFSLSLDMRPIIPWSTKRFLHPTFSRWYPRGEEELGTRIVAIRNKGIVIIKWERRSSARDIGGQFPGGEMDTSNPIRNGRLATGLRVIFIEAAIHPHFATPSVARLSSE